jgi:predicted acyl esterase
MVKQSENKFDPAEVELIFDLIPFGKSKFLGKSMKTGFPLMLKFMDYTMGPLFKLFKTFGNRIGQFLGLEPVEYEVVRLKEYLLPTSDGAKLATDVYLPKPIFKERFKGPTILIRLPYWKDMLSILGYLFASMGYITILQDTRGCAHSRKYGTNSFLLLEGVDGLDTLRWISKRFWYNGKIGMWGMSYFGITQIAVAKNHEGLLTCLNPGMASYHNILYHPYGLVPIGMGSSVYGVFYGVSKYRDMSEVPGISMMFQDPQKIPDRMAKYPLLNLYNEKIGEPSYIASFTELAKLGDPFKIISAMNEKLDLQLKGNEEDTGEFEKLLKDVAYTRKVNPQSVFFPHAIGFNFKPTVPMLYVAGHYDMFEEEFMRDLKLIQKTAPDYFKTNFKAVIGPWAHGGMDIAFNDKGKAGKMIHMQDIIDIARSFMPMWWFRFFLKEGGTDISKIPPLTVYILNTKIWRRFSSWPPKSTDLKMYLRSAGKANSRFGDGLLSQTDPKTEPPDEYDFNPANPVPMKGGRNLFLISGKHNQLKVEERPDVLVYTTERLTEGIEVIGEIKLEFYAASSAKDTDFTAKLVDVLSNGKAINVLDDGVRARYREGDLENPSLLEPQEVYQYTINLGTTAIYFPKGHRIRLEISSSNYPKYDVNSNLGGDQTEQGYQIAHQKIFHDAEHPSCLILPVFKRY